MILECKVDVCQIFTLHPNFKAARLLEVCVKEDVRPFGHFLLTMNFCSSISLFSQLNKSFWGWLRLRIADLFSITSTSSE